MHSTATERAVRRQLHDDLVALQALQDTCEQLHSERDDAAVEVQDLEASLELLRATLARSRAKYNRISSQISDTSVEICALHATLDSSRKVLRTMATFPLDVLVHIFTFACEPDVDHEGPDIDWSSAVRPYAIAGVCRHWRRVATGTPVLWQNIAASSRIIEDSPCTPFMRHVDNLLDRSTARTLDVIILLDVDANDDDARPRYRVFWTAFFSRLIPHVTRLRSLIVRADKDPIENECLAAFRSNLFDLLRCRTPRLVELSLKFDIDKTISMSRHWHGFPNSRFPSFLPHAPALECLDLKGAPVLFHLPHALFPSLASIAFTHALAYLVHLWDTFALAPNLEQLSVDVFPVEGSSSGPNHVPRSPASLPVRILRVTGGMTSYFCEHTQVALPNLTTLDIQDWMFDDLIITDTLAQSVTDLSVNFYTAEERATHIAKMRSLRAIQRAHLTYNELDDDYDEEETLFGALCSPDDPMWPRLTSLTITSLGDTGGERDGILRLLNARNGPETTSAVSSDEAPLGRPVRIESVSFDTDSVPPWIAVQVKAMLGDNCVIVQS
ncbi:hypothetical protein EXIGLDRAFT_838775 [Exidia glandulosa HHB12029]|uniref:Uncharacterized protein n=1 Tax=Exidia glandulosa HHB12029 TaxID=1314781 RepID=A0A165FIC4_EXIGL|nr:hypothetical protein EXIGLDRAFT_838775 [Exidia glandulosa HHB12029]